MNPVTIDKVRSVFPAEVDDLMPTKDPRWREYQDKYCDSNPSWGFKLTSDLFYRGVYDVELVPQDGIDAQKAWTHIRTILGSFAPKHEDKTAACALLFEKWFKNGTWKTNKSKP